MFVYVCVAKQTLAHQAGIESRMTQHGQTQVKVNAFVDVGIGELISALSEIDGLETLESCQGDSERGDDAFVFFRMNDWRQAGQFLFERLLAAMSPDLRSMVSLRLEAYDVSAAQGSIVMDPCALSLVTQCVCNLIAPVSPRPLMTGDAHGDTITQGVRSASGIGMPVMEMSVSLGKRGITPARPVVTDRHGTLA